MRTPYAAMGASSKSSSQISRSSVILLNGSFIVLEFPQDDVPDLLYISHVVGGMHLEKLEQVREARMVFDHPATALRDSKAPDSGVLVLDNATWSHFADALQD